MKTLPSAIETGKIGDFERVILIRIIPTGSDSWSELCWATKDITVTAWEGGGSSKTFVGKIIAEDNLGVIQQSVKIEEGGNIAMVGGLEFSIANPEYYGHTRFDESFAGYNFENREIEIRLVFWTGSNPTWSDTLQLYRGVIEDVEYKYSNYKISVRDAQFKKHKLIPDLILTAEDYPGLPNMNKNKTPPLLYGTLTSGAMRYNSITCPPMVKIDKSKLKFMVARNKCDLISIDYIFMFFDDVQRFAVLTPESSIYTINYGRPCTLEFPLSATIKGHIHTQGESQGIKTSPSTLDFADAVDDSIFTSFTLGASQKLYLRFPVPPEFARLQPDSNLHLTIEFGIVVGSGTIKYYNPEWDAGLGGFSTGIAFSSGDSDSDKIYDFGGDKSKHGKEDDQSDQYASWTFDEVGLYEFGLECNAGSSAQIKNIWVLMADMLVKALIIHKEGKAPRRRGMGKSDWPKEKIDFIQSQDSLFSYAQGADFGSWVDADARNNGYNEGALIEFGAYQIESILRDELGLTSSDIKYASFDELGNTTDGDRKDWKFASVISDARNSLEIIKEFCKQCAMIYFQNYEGKETVKVLSMKEAVKTIDRTTIMEDGIGISFSDLKNVYNEFYVNYDRLWANGIFRKTLFLTASDHNLSSNSRSGSPDTYTGLCTQSQTKYNTINRLTLDCDWIRDDATAELLIKWLADWFCYRKPIVEFESAGLDHIELELGDQIDFDHTLVTSAVA